MREGQEILVVSREPQTHESIKAALEGQRGLDPPFQCRDLKGLLARMERSAGSAVIVDVDPEPARMLSDLEPIVARYPDTRFIVMSEEVRQDWLLQAMQVGARHYLLKDSVAAELGGVLDRILPNGHAKPSQCAMITVAGAGGGCGATTLAVNLANELRLATTSPTLLLDLDSCYGSAAAMVGLEGSYGLSDVLSDTRPIDAELIRSTVVHYGPANEGFDLLMNPATLSPYEPAVVDYKHLQRMLRVCKQNYRWIVVDASRLPLDVLSTLVQASMTTLLVFQMNVNDLRIAKGILNGLCRQGLSSDSIVPVASRHRKRWGMLSLQDVQRTLGYSHLGSLSNDFTSAQTAVNYGQPLAECAPRSTLRRDIRSLATSLIEAHAKHAPVSEW
jgi:pilus assembly protein CpaE